MTQRVIQQVFSLNRYDTSSIKYKILINKIYIKYYFHEQSWLTNKTYALHSFIGDFCRQRSRLEAIRPRRRGNVRRPWCTPAAGRSPAAATCCVSQGRTPPAAPRSRWCSFPATRPAPSAGQRSRSPSSARPARGRHVSRQRVVENASSPNVTVIAVP